MVAPAAPRALFTLESSVQPKSCLAAARLCLVAGASQAQDKVAHHIDTDPNAKITVVTPAEGVDRLMEGAKAANGTDYAPLVSALKARGVAFEVGAIRLKKRGLTPDHPAGQGSVAGGCLHRRLLIH